MAGEPPLSRVFFKCNHNNHNLGDTKKNRKNNNKNRKKQKSRKKSENSRKKQKIQKKSEKIEKTENKQTQTEKPATQPKVKSGFHEKFIFFTIFGVPFFKGCAPWMSLFSWFNKYIFRNITIKLFAHT